MTDEVVGEQASSVFADAQAMLEVILKEKKLQAKGIYGIFPANQVNDDDIELTDENGKPLQTFLTLRQQAQKTKGFRISLWPILLRQKTMELWIIWSFSCNHRFWCG